MEKLVEPARQILKKNWKDGFTIPAGELYPFQWNWDSGFTSIGLSYFNLDHAIQELESLFSGQWENGMIPHIIFHSENEKTYFRNYDFWKANVNAAAPDKPKTSGITQPAGFLMTVVVAYLESFLKKEERFYCGKNGYCLFDDSGKNEIQVYVLITLNHFKA